MGRGAVLEPRHEKLDRVCGRPRPHGL